MDGKITNETDQLISKMYAKNVPIKEIAQTAGVSYAAVYNRTMLLEKVNPETRKPYKSRKEYLECRITKSINPETGKPYESVGQYRERQRRKSQKKPKNEKLGRLITEKLEDSGKSMAWLSREIGVSKEAVSKYARGSYMPNDEIIKRLFSALEVPHQTIDELADMAHEYNNHNCSKP